MKASTKICGVCKKRKPDTVEYFSAYTTSAGNPSRRGTCKTCMSARAKRHHKERPDLREAAIQRRKARIRDAEGEYTAIDIERIRKRLRDKCFYCGVSLNGRGTVDHMTPLRKGGTHWPSNITLACSTCNSDKHGKTAIQFVRWRQLHKLPCTARARKLLKIEP
jgi:5-methylcytosine-specific restriction endonuclease McrA